MVFLVCFSVGLSADEIREILSLLEEGNIDYQLLKSSEDDSLTFVEKWESPEYLKKHMASPHFLNFNADCEEFIESNDIQLIEANKIEI